MPQDKPKRCIDKMGRVVIPNDIRKATGLQIGDEVTFEISGTGILIIPVTEHCVICGSKHDLCEYYGKPICRSCITDIKMM